MAGVLVAGCALATGWGAALRAQTAEERYPPIGQFVEIDGRQVHYLQTGAGPDLVLIHGASGNMRDFTFGLVDALSDRYRVTVFDRPGLGYTQADPAFAGAFDGRAEGPEAQAALLHRAARAIGIRDEIVLGHSYGGAVAMAWGLNHDPAALVVVSGATEPWPGGLGTLYTLAGTALGGALAAPVISALVPRSLGDRAVQAIFAPNDPPAGYSDHVGVGLALRTETFRNNAQQINRLRPHLVEMSARYDSLTLPIELVHGLADDIVPAEIHSERLAQQVESAHLTRLAGVGHMPHHVRPEAVTDAIDRAARRAGLR